MKAVEQQSVLEQGLVVPKSTGYVNIINKHRRAGSNGTTGDESCTTDEEEPELEEKKETNGMFEYDDGFGEKRKVVVPYIETDETDCAIVKNGYCEKEVDLSRRVPQVPRETKEPVRGDDDLQQVGISSFSTKRLLFTPRIVAERSRGRRLGQGRCRGEGGGLRPAPERASGRAPGAETARRRGHPAEQDPTGRRGRT